MRKTQSNMLVILLFLNSIFFSCSYNSPKDLTHNICNDLQTEITKRSNTLTNIIFVEKTIDFGDVPQDTVLFAKFHFTNSGNEPLYIYDVNPDCTCTAYLISKDCILPKDTAFIQLEYNTKNKHAEQKVYTIVEANTHTKFCKLTIKANVY